MYICFYSEMELRSYLLIVLLNLHSIFLTDIYASGTGSVSDPFQQYVEQGNEAVLQCRYERKRLKWSANGTIIASENAVIDPTKYNVTVTSTGLYYRLHVLNAQPGDELIYSCRGGLNEVYYIQLNLYAPPTRLYYNGSMDNKLEGTEGTDLLIRCTAEGGKPPPDVKVTILDGTGSNGIKEVNYTIPTISRDYHRRTIVCKATSNAFNISMTATAHIYLNLKPLTPIFNSKEISTEETEPLRVSCISYGSRPAATFTWTIGGKDVTSSSTTLQPVIESNDTNTVTSTLTLSVNRSHTNQIIICRASNTVGSVSVSKNLDVKYAPSIDVSNYTLLNSDGSTSILCIPSGNPNVYTYYKWQHKSPYGQLIRELDGNKILTLPNVRDEFKYQDSGVYVCTASNGVISSNGNLKQIGSSFITINAIPVFTVDNTEYTYGELGKSLDMSVHVYSGTKLTSVKWFKENYQVISSSDKYSVAETQNTVDVRFHNKVIKFDGYRVTLTITNITLDDFSSYVLQVANTIEQPVVYKKYMEPVGVPAPPVDLAVKKIYKNAVIIYWDAGKSVKINQTFYLEYRKQRSTLWKQKQIPIQDSVLHSCKYVYVLNNLEEGIIYEMRMFTENEFNRSAVTEIKSIDTTESEDNTTLVAILVSGTAGLIVGIFSLKIVGTLYNRIKREDKVTEPVVLNAYDDVDENVERHDDHDTLPVTDTQVATAPYEVLGRTDQPNAYEDLTPEEDILPVTDSQVATAPYEVLGRTDQPNAYEDLNPEKERTEKVYENELF